MIKMPGETISVRGRAYPAKDIIAISKLTDRGDIIALRVASGEAGSEDFGIAPGDEGYAALDDLRTRYYELAMANERQQLLYDIVCDALVQREPISTLLLRILIAHIGVSEWGCQELVEPLREWARMLELPGEVVDVVLRVLACVNATA